MAKHLNERNAKVYYKKRIDILNKNIDLGSNKKILDIGCGDGTFLKYLKEMHPKLSCFGVDISPTQLQVAKYKNDDAKFCVAKAESLPFADKQFDIVIFNSVLHHVNEVELSIKNALRLCKDAGVMVSIEPNRLNPFIFVLSLIKKSERGQLRLSLGRLRSLLAGGFKSITTSSINSLCFPYRMWPPQKFFAFIRKLEDSPLFFARLRSHFVIIAKHKLL
ncbi:MAG: class I SAM-dependent methyltransferase [Candidatus Omnitrophica bacterium]|nr:class I SAM-dependent methyltransferase [Candidatus Omnitrophota bacterium]